MNVIVRKVLVHRHTGAMLSLHVPKTKRAALYIKPCFSIADSLSERVLRVKDQ